jgi:hypothetical protein
LSSSTGFTTLQTEFSGPFLVDGSYYVDRLLLSFMGVLPASMIVATIAAAITAAVISKLLTRAASFSLVLSNPAGVISENRIPW